MKERLIGHTNIRVVALADASERLAPYPGLTTPTVVDQWSRALTAFSLLGRDDAAELAWVQRLRPARALIAPAEAFAHGVKKLMPAIRFNTYDPDMAKMRRAENRERILRVTAERRAAQVAPPAILKAPADPRKLPKDSVHLGVEAGEEDEVMDLLTGKSRKQRIKARRAARVASGGARRPSTRDSKLFVDDSSVV